MPLPLRTAALATALVVGITLAGACRSDRSDGGRASMAPTTAARADADAGEGALPQPSPRAAVEAFLAAEQSGDHPGSLRLLTTDARRSLTSSEWARLRSEVPAVTGFSVEGADGDTVVAMVEHRPGLDPFIGLSPGRTRQTWRAREEGAGWLLEREPEVEALHPPADEAPAGALAWARATQACDAEAARSHQAIDVLFGVSDAPATLCGRQATVAVGPPERLAAGPASQELVGQYGAEAYEWARAVAVTGGERPFHVVLAPIGSVWRVVGVFEP